jgi:hypothetical protein
MTLSLARRLLLPGALALALAYCGDDGTGPDRLGTRAELTLSYTGSLNGTLQARGEPEAGESDFEVRTFAAAVDYPDGLAITGALVRSANDADVVTFAIPEPAVGTYSLGFSDEGLLVFGTDPQAELQGGTEFTGRLFLATGGTVSVTAASPDGVRGTVKGDAIELDLEQGEPTGAAIHFQGSFDVPVVDPPGSNGGIFSRAPSIVARLLADGVRR